MEQLTKVTDSLLQLTALAAYSGRQVVVPFVKDSFFHGTMTGGFSKTLAFYYNLTALNNALRSHSHATLISWSKFQDVCKGRLDVLVRFNFTNLSTTTTYSAARPFTPCENQPKTIQDIKIAKTICMNVFALDSVEKFENEVVERLPCVGILKWMGADKGKTFRTQFDLKSVVHNRVLSNRDVNILFHSKLLLVAQDFIAKNIGPLFTSVHIRSEIILKHGGSLSLVKKCISKLTARVQKIGNPVYTATDFSEFGSLGGYIKPVREKARSLMKILSPLKPITFQPSEYNLTDGGAAAIVSRCKMFFTAHFRKKIWKLKKKNWAFPRKWGGGGAPLEMRAASLPAIFRGEHILAQKPLFSEEPRHQTPHFRRASLSPKINNKVVNFFLTR